MKNLVLYALLLVLVLACNETTPPDQPDTPDPPVTRVDTVIKIVEVPVAPKSEPTPDVELSDSAKILIQANRILEIFKNKTFEDLTNENLISQKGVRFSPYATIEPELDILWKPDGFKRFTDKVLTWGVFDGSGDAILMKFPEFADRFIFDYDFRDSDSTLLNQVRQRGNLRNNIPKVYPEAQFVEFYVSGKNGAYAGFDWRVLRLVFEEEAGEWKLVGIVHSEWTS